jgi:hypothetical protein
MMENTLFEDSQNTYNGLDYLDVSAYTEQVYQSIDDYEVATEENI